MLQKLPPAILAAFQSHADHEAPKEACGMVIKLPDGSFSFRACRNAHEDPLGGFEIDVRDWDAAEDDGEPAAVLHSHPRGDAKASNLDRAGCQASEIPWFILGQGGELVRVDPADATPEDMALLSSNSLEAMEVIHE